MRLTDTFLHRIYYRFNKKYFGNKLPKDMPCLFDDIGKATGVCRIMRGRPQFIAINKSIKKDVASVCTTLLHEMVHVLLPHLNHGPKFHKEMLRLAKAGAFKEFW